MLKRVEIRIAVLGIALLGTATAWYLVSPLFTAPMLRAGFPTLAILPSRTPLPPSETPEPTLTSSATPEIAVVLRSENSTAVLFAEGAFYDVAYTGAGFAKIFLLADGRVALQFQDFEVEDGPDLHVYLSIEDEIKKDQGEPLGESFDLGLLTSLSGEQIYELPNELDFSIYHSVVIWSAQLQIPFIAAPLETAN